MRRNSSDPEQSILRERYGGVVLRAATVALGVLSLVSCAESEKEATTLVPSSEAIQRVESTSRGDFNVLYLAAQADCFGLVYDPLTGEFVGDATKEVTVMNDLLEKAGAQQIPGADTFINEVMNQIEPGDCEPLSEPNLDDQLIIQ